MKRDFSELIITYLWFTLAIVGVYVFISQCVEVFTVFQSIRSHL
jgi:hypothetical protein